MATRRVILTGWEWACCGDPFRVGDRVTLRVDPVDREQTDAWLGADLTATIDLAESHHEDGGADAVTGTVAAIHGVTMRFAERRERRPRLGPPQELQGPGFRAVAAQHEFVIVSEPVPGSASLVDVPAVPWPPRDSEEAVEGLEGVTDYLVDLELS